MILLNLQPDGETVHSTLTVYMGGERFQDYRRACYDAGARWSAHAKANILALGQVPTFLRALQERDLPVTVAPAIAERLNGSAAEAQGLLYAGRSRLAAVEAKLAERGLKLYPFQRTGIEWLSPRKRALLGDQMGLGKTVQALLALPEGVGALVVAPAAVARNWVAECRAWRADLRPDFITTRDAWRLPRAGELLVCTYGLLPKTEKEAGEPTIAVPSCPVYLIADEAHYLKNPKALRTARFAHLRDLVLQAGGCWLLTGTPLLNRPPELWAVLEAARLGKDAFGSFPAFAASFNAVKGKYGVEWGLPSETVPLALQKVSLVRRREQVLPDLPRKRHQDLIVNGLPAGLIKLLDEAVEALRSRGLNLDGMSSDTDVGKHIAGPVFELMSKARAQLAAAKLPAVVELVEEYEEADEPVIVFACHVEPLHALAQRPGWGLIDGGVPTAERQRLVAEFQAGNLRGLACSIAAAGVGITLTRASHAIFLNLDWTPALNMQAEDRLCRIGQTRGVLIKRVIANHPLDQRVSELLLVKQELIEATVDASAVEADHVAPSPAEVLAHAAQAAAAAVAEVATVAPPPTPRHEGLDLPGADAVVALLERASENLKKPKLRMSESLTAYVAGPASRYCGDVMLVEPGYNGRYYGRIHGGKVIPGRDWTDAIGEQLQAWEADPSAAAASYGRQIGSCCFCGLTLTDERSVTVGYGPICAEKWGLPWGQP